MRGRGDASPLFFYMIAKEKVIALAEERIQELNNDNYLVQVSVSNKNQIKVVMDNLHRGISIKDCMSVSRNIEHNLDRSVEDFQLEVTSPGLDQPFVVEQQYIKNIGRKVSVTTTENQTFLGELLAVNENDISVLEHVKPKNNKAKKMIPGNTIFIEKSKIKESKLIISI